MERKESDVYLCEMKIKIHNYDSRYTLPHNVPLKKIDHDKVVYLQNFRTSSFENFSNMKEHKTYRSLIASLNGYEIISISERSVTSIMHLVYSREFDYILRNINNRKCIQWSDNAIYFFCRIKKDNINI